MTKITIKVKNDSNTQLLVSNSNDINVAVKMDDGSLKASDVFKLFDNGVDVEYECSNEKVSATEGQNLSRVELMYNDCLELINSIIKSVNQKIVEFQKNKEDEKEEN